MATKQCSKCGNGFSCTAPVAGCWCEQYTLTAATLTQLKAHYKDCLCPECLAEFAGNQSELPEMPVNKE